jgi:hypothetical protein
MMSVWVKALFALSHMLVLFVSVSNKEGSGIVLLLVVLL